MGLSRLCPAQQSFVQSAANVCSEPQADMRTLDWNVRFREAIPNAKDLTCQCRVGDKTYRTVDTLSVG